MRIRFMLITALLVSSFYGFSQNTFPSSGNVGISTTAPQGFLHVKSSVNGQKPLIMEGVGLFALQVKTLGTGAVNTATHRISLVYNFDNVDRNGYIEFIRGESGSNGALAFGSNGIERLRVSSNGNVGIGTTNPSTMLEVNGNIKSASVNTNDIGAHNLTDGFNYDGKFMFNYGIKWPNDSWSTNGSSAWISGYGGIKLFTATQPRLVIRENGNVGIGTTAPLANLHIQNPSTATNTTIIRLSALQGAGYSTEIINEYNTNNAFQIKQNGFNILRSSGDAYNLIELGNSTNRQLNLLTHTTGKVTVPNARLIVGSEPITGSPILADANNKVLVNGNIVAKKVKVTQTGWADYVFDQSYPLMPLNAVADFIKDHKHLPQVPSAAEVEKEGIDIGDNQAILLRKIEELTLYIIEQQKQIDALKPLLDKAKSKKH